MKTNTLKRELPLPLLWLTTDVCIIDQIDPAIFRPSPRLEMPHVDTSYPYQRVRELPILIIHT